MELLFRKYFWTVNLAFLALAGILSARTVNTFVAASISEPPLTESDGPVAASRPSLFGGVASIDLERTARAFGIELPKDEPEEKAPEPAYDPNAEPVKSSLHAALVGTMAANRPEWSFATIRDLGSQNVGVYLPGDTFLGTEILSVERMRVVILNNGRKEYLAIGEVPGPAPTMPQPAVATNTSGGDGITQVDENNYVIPREEIDKQLSNLNSIATQARIVPSFKNGVANGFKLFSIRPGSIYSKIGIQNGDVIKKINGYEINSPEKALEVYSKLKEASKIEIEFERRGKQLNNSYAIR